MNDTDRDRYARIIEWLRPGSLRTTETCPRCKGECGFVLAEHDSQGIPSGQYFEDCPTCNGHGDVFREDDEGLGVILQAMQSAIIVGLPLSPSLVWWNRRVGKEWCAALENRVREYKPEPQDFGTLEGLAALKAMLREDREIIVAINLYWDGAEVAIQKGLESYGPFQADTEAAALIAAVEATMPEDKKGENDA